MTPVRSVREIRQAGPANESPVLRFIANQTPKRRSSQACLECRRRKVRCDIMIQKFTVCTNCRHDRVMCEIGRCKRRRRKSRPENPSPPTPQSIGLSLQNSPPKNSEVEKTHHEWDSPQVESEFSMSPSSFTFSGTTQPNLSPDVTLSSFIKAALPIASQDVILPAFIKPLAEIVSPEDLQYLSSKRCFSFPPLAFQKIILHRFVEFVHPLLPIFDVDELVTTISGESQNQMSLLLYHAVMGAGLAAVETEVIQRYGFISKAAARNDSYCKAKALLNLDVETDHLINCQAAMLFISWAKNNGIRDGLQWSGLALSHGLSINLHQSASTALDTSAMRKLKRRIWWTILMKDADVCLSMGKPPRVASHNVPMLQNQDFERETNLDYADCVELNRTGEDLPLQNMLQAALISKASLSLVVHKVLKILHPMDLQRSSPSRNSKIWQLDAELQDWRHGLPAMLWHLNRSSDAILDRRAQVTVSTVNLTFLMAVIMLHKPEVPMREWVQAINDDSEWCLSDQKARFQAHARTMRRAADDMTTIHKELHELGLTKVIPAIGLATICAAVSVHLLDARSNQESIRCKSLEQLNICIDVLHEIKNIHDTAAGVVKLVESAIHAVQKPTASEIQASDSVAANTFRHSSTHNQYSTTSVSCDDFDFNQIPQDSIYSPVSFDYDLQMESLLNCEWT